MLINSIVSIVAENKEEIQELIMTDMMIKMGYHD